MQFEASAHSSDTFRDWPYDPSSGAIRGSWLGMRMRGGQRCAREAGWGLIEEGPLSITRLTEGADVSRQAVTKHLQVLASVGLVKNARDGRENVWQLEPRRLEEARRLRDLISQEWDDTLGRLKAFVEK